MADGNEPPAPRPEAAPQPAPPCEAPPAAAGRDPAAPDADALTPEEQMERFERELKETDWGHQPC